MLRGIIAAGVGIAAIVTTAACTATVAGSPVTVGAATSGVPTVAELKSMLLTSDDISALTNSTWTASTPPDDNSNSGTGCAALDATVLGNSKTSPADAHETLTDAHGELLNEDLSFDRNATSDLRQVAAALTTCPTVTIDGQRASVQQLSVPPVGDSSAAVEVDLSGVSVALMFFSYQNYVVGLVMRDEGYAPTFFQTIEQTALNRLGHSA